MLVGELRLDADTTKVTILLAQLSQGDRSVIERLMPLVYAELHRRAASIMRRERSDHTLQPTALVHEAYLKLVQQREPNFKNRVHFFAMAAHLMRRILADHARAKLSAKRGGRQDTIVFDDAIQIRSDTPAGLVAVDEALAQLALLDPRQEQIVEMRFFGGLTVEEVDGVLGVSTRTVEREWTMARAWLYAQLKEAHVGH